MSHEYDATVGQVGFRIILQLLDRDPLTQYRTPANVSAAVTKEVNLKKPDATTKVYTGGDVTFTPAPIGIGDGTDGYIEASTVVGDFDQVGIYEVAGYIADAVTDGPTQIAKINVGPSLR
tara:strand:- start:1905 stop:2264 length:360 start_codon:yes stop_codon:yes gene_type:complete